jgi:hypothetical protein
VRRGSIGFEGCNQSAAGFGAARRLIRHVPKPGHLPLARSKIDEA